MASLAFSLQGEQTAAAPGMQFPEGKRLTMDVLMPDDMPNQFYYFDGLLVNPSDGLSEFMVGKVAVGLILPESTGVLDPDEETWTPQQVQKVDEEVRVGFNWWPKFEPEANLSIVIEPVRIVPTKYEPINYAAYSPEEDRWLDDVFTNMGYPAYMPLTQKLTNEAIAVRDRNGADQVVLVIVVNSEVDSDGLFTNFISEHTWPNRSHMIMTYDNNGFGIDDMEQVAAHALAHTLGEAPDQGFNDACTDLSWGYLKEINGNSLLGPGCVTDLPSIMRPDVEGGYLGNHLDPFARVHIGWGDKDGNGILDSAGRYQLKHTSRETGSGIIYTGTITNTALRPPPGWTDEVNFNHIAAMTATELFTGQVYPAQASDGSFDSQVEGFSVTIGVNAQLVNFCVTGGFGGTYCEIILNRAAHNQYLPTVRK